MLFSTMNVEKLWKRTTGAKESKKPQGCPSSSTQPTLQPTLLKAIEKSQQHERKMACQIDECSHLLHSKRLSNDTKS